MLILCCTAVAVMGVLSEARAQQRKSAYAHIGYVQPAGGQQGSTVTVRIGGENVYGATAALVSGTGVVAEVVDSRDPNEDQMDPKKKNRKKNEAAIDEIVTLKITIAPDAGPGDRDICLVTTNMISNKLIFQVGQLREVLEVEPNNKRKVATPLSSMPVVVSGQILPGDVDWFQFKAVKGQHLVVDVAARALLPYIADGVPGWFQAVVALCDIKSNVVAVADSFRFSQDPVLIYEVPEDGEYALSIRDSIYRGREDFGYRMRMGELPLITGIFPLGGGVGTSPVPVRVSGVNLPGDKVLVGGGNEGGASRYVMVTNNGLLSNRIRFEGGKFPEVVGTEPATQIKNAREVILPVVVNGCIRVAGEKHYYRFQGVKGQVVGFEVQARRLGSSLDSSLMLLDSGGKKLAENDDVKDMGEGFLTHHADSGMTCTLPEGGVYRVIIQDVQGKGGADYAYRLRMGPPEPDFDLRMTPAAVMVPKGGSVPMTVYALRRDGFAGEIQLSIKEAMKGLSLDGALIPAGVDKMTLTLSTTEQVTGQLMPRIMGTATVAGKVVVREAVPAENLMQAFLYQHLFPFQEETVMVTPLPVPFLVNVTLPLDGILKLTRGKETNIVVTVTRSEGFSGGIRLQLDDPPKGLTFRNAWIAANKMSATVTLRAESSLATNLQGNLIITGSMQVEREATAEEKKRMAAKAAREREAKVAALGTNAVVEQRVVTTVPSGEAVTNKPVMVSRPVVVTFPAVPFRLMESPVPVKVPTPLVKGQEAVTVTQKVQNAETTEAKPKTNKD
jgi:hypothetical protein